MRTVVVEVRNGEAFVVRQPRNVEVIIRHEKRRSAWKVFRTLWYKVTH